MRLRQTARAVNRSEPTEAELRELLVRAWARVSALVGGLLSSGHPIPRDVLLDIARFLESAEPTVAAYDRLLAALEAEGDAAAVLAILPTGEGER